MAPLKPHLKRHAASAPPDHAKRLDAASTAQVKARRQVRAAHWVEDTSTTPLEATEDIDAVVSDSEITMVSSDPIMPPDSDSSFTSMAVSSDISSDAIAEEPARQPMSEMIHGIPAQGQDVEWDAFLEDDSDVEADDEAVVLDSSDVDWTYINLSVSSYTCSYTPITHITADTGLHNPMALPEVLADFFQVGDDPGCITDELLNTAGAAYHVDWNMFVCCETMFHGGNIWSHFCRTPKHTKLNRPGQEVKDHVELLVAQWDMPVSYEAIEPTIVPRRAVLSVPMIPDLHGCPHCPYTGGLKYVKAHLAKRPHPTALERDILTGLSAHMISRVNYRVTPYTPSNPLPSTPSLAMQIAAADLDTSAPVAANARLVSPFLNRTKWHEIREPFNEHLPELVELASFPSETEFPLLADVVRTYFRKADALFEHTEELVLQHLNTHDPAKSGINNTPFHRHHMGDTTAQQYVVVVIRLIAALLRQSNVFSMEPSEPLTLAIEALRASLLDHRQDVKDAQPHLHVIFGALWHSRWRQTATTRMPDPTMRFLMLLSSQPGGEFAAPKDTSGPIRKLCWAIQMHALAEIHRIVEVEGVFQMEAYNRVSEFVIEKDITTYATLWSLQHYVTTLSMQTLSMPKIWWLDRETWQEMLYKGHKITLLQLQEVFTNLEAEITSMWEDMVLLGLDLNVEWSEIADDLTEKRAGYSFLEDERNPFHAFKDAFAKALDADLETRKKFTTAASNYTELDLIKCREWLFRLAKLEGLVMLIIDMLGGAPPRGTELTSMLACNSPFRLRNLAALGKFIAIIRQYDKTSNITQSDRLIPHSISAVAADILIQIHTIARPWAKFLASKVWPRDPNVSRAYGEMLFMDVGQMFTSDKLTHLMATKTGHVLGWEVTIASWRHINIAWRRKLCGGSAELLDQEAMSTVNALQGGHSSHTENMVYGLSPDALAGAPEDVLFLFLVASGE
ncbi:hypothetical protein K438DRAFT_1781334 [Mycena galopus ATCC 62051]|nr:hypothetical protein K438DRAFT_1781334 [Mycena galopus ATCC 62051]